jgi:hypothetical protein
VALSILYTEEAIGKVRGSEGKEEADGQPWVTSRLAWLQPLLAQERLCEFSQEAPRDLSSHLYPKSVTCGERSCGSISHRETGDRVPVWPLTHNFEGVLVQALGMADEWVSGGNGAGAPL